MNYITEYITKLLAAMWWFLQNTLGGLLVLTVAAIVVYALYRADCKLCKMAEEQDDLKEQNKEVGK